MTPWTVAHQSPPSMESSRQEYWCGLPFPSPWDEYWCGLPLSSPGDLPNPGIEPGSPALPANSLPSEPSGKTQIHFCCVNHTVCGVLLWQCEQTETVEVRIMRIKEVSTCELHRIVPGT